MYRWCEKGCRPQKSYLIYTKVTTRLQQRLKASKLDGSAKVTNTALAYANILPSGDLGRGVLGKDPAYSFTGVEVMRFFAGDSIFDRAPNVFDDIVSPFWMTEFVCRSSKSFRDRKALAWITCSFKVGECEK